ncbi:MAG: hypothetical protein LBV16_04550 [Elusimicrobiota bacterium]|jgi:predicted AAA+ superfamily ATPase|nr:hypothetical protein [Elusimicrobiota bacterium]
MYVYTKNGGFMFERTMAGYVNKISSQYPVLLLTGMRQIGKSTLLQMISEPERI